jgi:hypothetical protein
VAFAVKFPVGADVVTVAAKVVYQVKVPVAQLLVMLTGLPAQIGLEAKTGVPGIGFTVCVTEETALAQLVLTLTHLAKYVVLAVKFPVGADVVTVAAEVVYQVKFPVAQLLVMLAGLPAHIGLEAKTGESGIGFTICVTDDTALIQPVVASRHLAKYVVLAVKFPVGAVVVTVAAKVVYQVKVPVAQLLVILTGLPAQIGLEVKTGVPGIGFTI